MNTRWMRPRVERSTTVVLVLAAAVAAGSRSAAGQALPVHAETAITAGFQENAARGTLAFFGRSAAGEVGAAADGAEAGARPGSTLDVLVVGTGIIPFSLSPLWTVRLRLPWLTKDVRIRSPGAAEPVFETSGFGDPVADTKWIFYRNDRRGATTRVGILAGVKAPVGDTDARLSSGEVASRPLQLGTGSWDFPFTLVATNSQGRWGMVGNLGWRLNTRSDGFDAGDVFTYDLVLGYRLLPKTYGDLRDQTLVGYVELNGEVSGQDRVDGTRNADSGGHVLFLSPDLQWIPAPWLLFEASLQVPVVQELDGSQLDHDVRFHLGSRIRFSVFR